ncbi:cytochrome C [Candidatus Endobugula sertula]|uniref:Cytochrome C n=1 Tax=Candidatus Endobugula sertula TaxID=62101 RepID=A0A1D2QMQ1_9GAMM|nr:cytochrome C [Candidatus Endobugula sertula]
MKPQLIITSFIAIFLVACSEPSLEAPKPPAFVKETPIDWRFYQQQKNQKKSEYISQHQAAYDWFADFAFSETDGVPYIILRLLPVIAPELWGSEENFLDVIGLFYDTRQVGYPMPRGIGISAFTRKKPLSNIDYTSFTCAACHIGRVYSDAGEIIYIDGGVNTEFNIVSYRVRVFQTLQKMVGSETDPDKKNQLWIDGFLTALGKAQATSPNFFYKAYKNSWVDFNTEYEKQQIKLFKQQSSQVIPFFANRAEDEYHGYAALLNKNYKGFQERSLEGFPGMADATGISAVNSYIDVKKSFWGGLFANFILPTSPGITDFMSVWEQDKRKVQWDNAHQRLINGGGQWNGNIPIPMYRNLAAQLTLGLKDNDIRVAAFGVELLDGLPASVYPFDVNIDLAKKGEALFAEHCAQCHQPRNGKIYSNLNVNLDRSYVVNWLIRKGGVDKFYKACSPETVVNIGTGPFKPCAEYESVSLKGKKQLIMSPNDNHHGYNARPLSGIWAQAPYLHNGSVPTMYHLLVPDERPETFIKSRLTYDQKMLGFAWQEGEGSLNDKGYLFDTTSFATFSSVGHDTDIKEDGITYKLNWSDDKEGAWALIEYLKTL